MKFHNSVLNMKISLLLSLPGTNSAHLEVVVQIYYANLLGLWGSKWDIVRKIVSMCSQ